MSWNHTIALYFDLLCNNPSFSMIDKSLKSKEQDSYLLLAAKASIKQITAVIDAAASSVDIITGKSIESRKV